LPGGRLGDRSGNHQTIALGFALQIPAMFLLARAESPFAILALTALAGALMSVPGSSMLALGHFFLPGRVGLASGVTVGLAITAGGMLAPWLGALADRHGAAAVIGGLAWVPIAAVAAMLGIARLKRATARLAP
jgi:FSR family fosmidomycin resistance protein-like MFS transporter